MGKKTVTRLAIVSKGSKFREKRPLEVERLTDCYVMLGRHESDFANFWSLFVLKFLALCSAVSPFHRKSILCCFKIVASPVEEKSLNFWGVMEYSNGTSTIHGRSMSYWKGFFCQLCWIYQKCEYWETTFWQLNNSISVELLRPSPLGVALKRNHFPFLACLAEWLRPGGRNGSGEIWQNTRRVSFVEFQNFTTLSPSDTTIGSRYTHFFKTCIYHFV